MQKVEGLAMAAAGFLQLALKSLHPPQVVERYALVGRAPDRLAESQRRFEPLLRRSQLTLGEEHFAHGAQGLDLPPPVSHLDGPLAGLLQQRKRLGQLAPIALELPQVIELRGDADGAAEPPRDGERLLVGLLRAREV